jgi:hypothetical protein
MKNLLELKYYKQIFNIKLLIYFFKHINKQKFLKRIKIYFFYEKYDISYIYIIR